MENQVTLSGGTDIIGFDYANLTPEEAEETRQAAQRVRGLIKASIIEAGRDLIAVKSKLSRLGRGTFSAWLQAEFGMTDRTAQNYMRAASEFGDFPEIVSVLPQALVYQLAAKSTPESIREDVILKVGEGQRPEPNKIYSAIREAKQQERERQEAEQKADRLAKLSPEERANLDRKAERRHRTKAQREAEQAREREEQKAKGEREERAAQEAIELLAERLGADFERFKSLFEQAGWRFRGAIEAA